MDNSRNLSLLVQAKIDKYASLSQTEGDRWSWVRSDFEEVKATLAASTEPMPYEDALTLAQAAAEKYPHPNIEQRAPFIDGYVAALGYPRAASSTEPTLEQLEGLGPKLLDFKFAQPEPEDALLYPFETWAQGQGLDPNGDVAYHYAKAGWDAALRAVSQPTREQIERAILAGQEKYMRSVQSRGSERGVVSYVTDAVLALFGKRPE